MILPSSAIIRPFAFSLLLRLLARGAVRARPRLGTGDRDGAVVDARWTVRGIVGKRVPEIIDVVALLEAVETLVRPARLLAVERRIRHRLRDVEQITQLDGEQPLGIPDARLVLDIDVPVARLQLVELVAGSLQILAEAIDAAAAFHAQRHFVAQYGDALGSRMRHKAQRACPGCFGLLLQRRW